MYEKLLDLDTTRINFSAGGMHIVNIVLAFVMFGVALGIKPSMFREILRSPKSVLVGVLSQVLVLPALTFILVVLLGNTITPMVAMGMILVASCPGGNISNFISQLSKGNIELSVSLTAISTSFSPLIMPFNFSLWGSFYVNYVNNHAHNALQELSIPFFNVFETVLLLLGLPLLLGLLTSKFLPKIANFLKKPMQYLSIAFFLVMVIMAFKQNFDIFLQCIVYIFGIVLIHNLLALLIGYLLGTAFRLPLRDRKTISIETGIQNSGLALVLLFNPNIFPPDLAIGGMLIVTAWWGVWHIISGLSIATFWNRKEHRKAKTIC
ncbi:MAG: bile acid:sodium symporter family protein [Bacteroidales bacterium]|jgi:BASS family bile acid:Na+ symporter|nr:bile acid:sodium symporter family protein [Bacteroidales bacterium]